MEEDILNYSLTVMFRGTPYIKQLIIIMEEDILNYSRTVMYLGTPWLFTICLFIF